MKQVQIPQELFDFLVFHFFENENHEEEIKTLLLDKVQRLVAHEKYTEYRYSDDENKEQAKQEYINFVLRTKRKTTP